MAQHKYEYPHDFFLVQKCQCYTQKIATAAADNNIEAPPALATRIKDGKDYVLLPDFINAYRLIKKTLLCSKTKENSFQTLNRTI